MTLINFALAAPFDVLEERYRGRLFTTSEVLAEASRGLAEGYDLSPVRAISSTL